MKRPRRHRCDWTPAEDARLERDWHDVGAGTIARRLARTPAAVVRRAAALGLRTGVPQGCISVDALARRECVDRVWLARVLAAAGVPLRKHWGRTAGAQRPHRYVDEGAAAAALEAYFKARDAGETVHAAARARGLNPGLLHKWLARAGLLTPRGPGRGDAREHRVPSAAIDRVIVAHPRRRAA